MCFGKKPKMKSPNIATAIPNQTAPIADQTPKVESGADLADTNRSKKRAANPNSGLSLFQIQLVPGAGNGTDEPGASTGGNVGAV